MLPKRWYISMESKQVKDKPVDVTTGAGLSARDKSSTAISNVLFMALSLTPPAKRR